MATPDVGIMNEEGVNDTAFHVPVDESLPLVFVDYEPHRKSVAVKDYSARASEACQRSGGAVPKLTYKARVRSSREIFDTAFKKGLGGIPL